MSAACILGCAGPTLSAEEAAFFADVRPWGFILFARNIETSDQTRALIEALRRTIDDEGAPVLVDQEGGRVQRLKPPLAKLRPPAARFGELYARDPEAAIQAVFLNHRLLADELASLGFDADCAPCVDLIHAGAHALIGDRSLGSDVGQVSRLGRAAMEGLLAGGVAPIIKHIPGHGRATADSHYDLPVVDTSEADLSETDFAPFRALADAPMAMTAHVLYSAIDHQACATVSQRVIQSAIRGRIGFDGLLMSDDLSMKALGGTLAERTRRSLEAGCDIVLHGNGALVGEPVRDLAAELKAIADVAPALDGRAAARAGAARAAARRVQPFDAEAAEARLAELGLEGKATR
jgi:beta-N-acetylhexosaminidase